MPRGRQSKNQDKTSKGAKKSKDPRRGGIFTGALIVARLIRFPLVYPTASGIALATDLRETYVRTVCAQLEAAGILTSTTFQPPRCIRPVRLYGINPKWLPETIILGQSMDTLLTQSLMPRSGAPSDVSAGPTP